MQTVLQQSYAASFIQMATNPSVWSRFITWCKNQEEKGFGWLAIALTGHGCVITPLTLFIIMYTGNSMILWGIAIAAMGISLVTNLAALSTRITIPTFLFSILLDLAIIIACLVEWL